MTTTIRRMTKMTVIVMRGGGRARIDWKCQNPDIFNVACQKKLRYMRLCQIFLGPWLFDGIFTTV